jgi:hypothetical protein
MVAANQVVSLGLKNVGYEYINSELALLNRNNADD